MYTILHKLGAGAFAEVKLCRHSATNDDVALKCFNKGALRRHRTVAKEGAGGRRMSFSTALDKVTSEIAIMKKLRHGNLVHLIDVIDDADTALYMVIEYCPGGPVMTYDPKKCRFASRATGGAVAEDLAVAWLADMLAGLAYLHEHKIAHRDLKPDNVLLAADGRAKIADFGVAHFFEEEVAPLSSPMLTPRGVALPDEPSERALARPGEPQPSPPRPRASSSPAGSPDQTARHARAPSDSPASRLFPGSPGQRPPGSPTWGTTLLIQAAGKRLSSRRGQLRRTEGTWAFWAPEMCRAGEWFSAYETDVWATGVCFFVFLAARLPFAAAECPAELYDAIHGDGSGATARVPPDVKIADGAAWLLAGLLECEPDERWTIERTQRDEWFRAMLPAATVARGRECARAARSGYDDAARPPQDAAECHSDGLVMGKVVVKQSRACVIS